MAVSLSDIQRELAKRKLTASRSDVISELNRRANASKSFLGQSVPAGSIREVMDLGATEGGSVSPNSLLGGDSAVRDITRTVASSAVAEPIAGVAGVAQAANPFAEEGASAEAVERVRNALEIPIGERGAAAISNLVSATPQWFKDAVGDADTMFNVVADAAADNFGPAAGAAVKTLPTATLELLGFKGARNLLKAAQKADDGRTLKTALDAAPSTDQLRAASKGIYTQLEDAGVLIKQDVVQDAISDARKQMRRLADNTTIAPQTSDLLQQLDGIASVGDVELNDIIDMRRLARSLRAEGGDAAGISEIVDSIDSLLDGLDPGKVVGASGAQNVGRKFRAANELWRRAKRAESLDDAVEAATIQASGFENGLRIQFRQILKSEKKRRFFKPEELDEMRKLVTGEEGSANLFKTLSKLGFGRGAGTNFLGGSIGVAAGASVAGPAGAVIMPVIGMVNAKMAERLVRNQARLANKVIRAGTDARRIAAAYAEAVPAAERSADELAQLFLRPDVDLSLLPSNELLDEAAQIAIRNRAAIAATVAASQGSGSTQAQQ